MLPEKYSAVKRRLHIALQKEKPRDLRGFSASGLSGAGARCQRHSTFVIS
jgi:hypothetical protein